MHTFLDERDKELIDGQIDELTNNVSELKGDIVEFKSVYFDYAKITEYTDKKGYAYYVEGKTWFANDFYHSYVVDVEYGQMYKIHGYNIKDNVYPQIVYFDENNQYISSIGLGSTGDYDITVTIPIHAKSMGVMSGNYRPPLVELLGVLQPTEIVNRGIITAKRKVKKMLFWKNGNNYYVRFKYNKNKDCIFGFASNHSVNKCFQMNRIFMVDNTSDFVLETTDGLSAETQFMALSSEWLSPYKLTAKNNIVTNDNNDLFVGGSHSINGKATMLPSVVSVFLDNQKTESEELTYCDSVKFLIENNIYGSNTIDSEGNGRVCVTESVLITVSPNIVEYSVEIKCKEDININTYYGFQQEQYSWSYGSLGVGSEKYRHYINDFRQLRYDDKKSGTLVSGWKLKSNSGDISELELDVDYGCGDRRYLNDDTPSCITESYGKYYGYLIDNKDFASGDIIKYRGKYSFYSLN